VNPIFKALQAYSDGHVVRWIDEPTPASRTVAAAGALAWCIAGVVLGLAALAIGLLGYRKTATR
jgi:hypothetical protein